MTDKTDLYEVCEDCSNTEFKYYTENNGFAAPITLCDNCASKRQDVYWSDEQGREMKSCIKCKKIKPVGWFVPPNKNYDDMDSDTFQKLTVKGICQDCADGMWELDAEGCINE